MERTGVIAVTNCCVVTRLSGSGKESITPSKRNGSCSLIIYLLFFSSVYTTTLIRCQVLKASTILPVVAHTMRGLNITLTMSPLWFIWTGLQGNNMVKDKTSRAFLDRWVNGLITDMANIPITLKNVIVVYLFYSINPLQKQLQGVIYG